MAQVCAQCGLVIDNPDQITTGLVLTYEKLPNERKDSLEAEKFEVYFPSWSVKQRTAVIEWLNACHQPYSVAFTIYDLWKRNETFFKMKKLALVWCFHTALCKNQFDMTLDHLCRITGIKSKSFRVFSRFLSQRKLFPLTHGTDFDRCSLAMTHLGIRLKCQKEISSHFRKYRVLLSPFISWKSLLVTCIILHAVDCSRCREASISKSYCIREMGLSVHSVTSLLKKINRVTLTGPPS